MYVRHQKKKSFNFFSKRNLSPDHLKYYRKIIKSVYLSTEKLKVNIWIANGSPKMIANKVFNFFDNFIDR